MSRLLIIFWSFLFLQRALAAGISETTNGIYVVVAAVRDGTLITNEPVRFDDELVWMPFCDTGKVMLSYPDARYGISMRMTDSAGKEVAKTTFCKQWIGSKFESLRLITDSKVANTVAQGSYKNNPNGEGETIFLRKPDELSLTTTILHQQRQLKITTESGR
ncbi:MAG TPA: hypothetical protein VMF08_23210 [Candidatus Sulfotelmatobacter sp.]|nr:hypothetical protein [Candidatus Sulfotelmatobacter sp.]